jgi:hypothetical protein
VLHTSEQQDPAKPAPKKPLTDAKLARIPTAEHTTSDRKLILTLEGEIIREYRIEDCSMSIGRKYGNDIQLNDLTLSGRHALITSIPDYVFIEDLGSTNGTMVNGNHIKKVALEHGDIIQIGHHQLTYLCEAEVRYEPTMFVKAEFDETQLIYADIPSDNIIKGLSLGGLRTLNGNVPKPVMELRKTYNTIGFQGKRMALITRCTKGYSITAVTSTRSRRTTDIPLLNDKPLSAEQHMLEEGDIISIAGFEVQFYFLS